MNRAVLWGGVGTLLGVSLTLGIWQRATWHAWPASPYGLTVQQEASVTAFFATAARHHQYEVTATRLHQWISSKQQVLMIDVRQAGGPKGYRSGHIRGAINIPLTSLEWDEWGNPEDPTYYAYMKSYSPYDNVAPQSYPHILIYTGLNDPRVGYFEPAKFVARLRVTKTDQHQVLLKTHMGAGHGGASGRLAHVKEFAEEYAFILDKLGINA